jgi:hypothetical protein
MLRAIARRGSLAPPIVPFQDVARARVNIERIAARRASDGSVAVVVQIEAEVRGEHFALENIVEQLAIARAE